MPDIFKTPSQITQELLDEYKDITAIELSPNDLGREEVIKFRSLSVVISGLRAELQRIEDDTFPQSASEQALERHLAARLLAARAAPQRSNGVCTFEVTAVPVSIPAQTVFARDLDGKLFRTIEAFSSSSSDAIGNVNLQCESVDVGQATNIEVESGVQFTLSSSVPNVAAAVLSATQFRDGRDQESPSEMLSRIQTFDRRRDTGGNLVAYERFAREASSQVVTAKAIDEPRGPNTVDVVITSGTSNIRQAVENGEAITRLPSSALVSTVQDYVREMCPTTDDAEVVMPTESEFDITVSYELYDESLRAAVDVEIKKEVEIYIYSAKAGDTLYPTELERLIDARVGHLIRSRRVADFGESSLTFTVPNGEILIPGTTTIQGFS